MRCAQKGCGSYAFNLAHDGVDQGSLCDVHYWQSQANQLKALNAELAAELQNIANANPKNWDAPLNDTASFQAWAQNRARAALEKHKGETS